jgi:phosphomannomutase
VNLKKPLRLVFDCSNGTTGIVLKKLKIPNSKIIILNSKPDGNFPAHGPNPSSYQALKQLSKTTKEFKADLGIAFDADGDRAFFVDETGKLIKPYLIAYLLFLNNKPPFIADITTFEALSYAKILPPKTFLSKTGTYFIKKEMIKRKASIGAEFSGHYYFKDFFYADSGIFTAIKIINIVSSLPYSLATFKKLMPQKILIKQLNLKTTNHEKVIKKITQKYQNKAKNIIKTDGVTFEFEKGWFTIRPSNTEPLIRLFIGKIL